MPSAGPGPSHFPTIPPQVQLSLELCVAKGRHGRISLSGTRTFNRLDSFCPDLVSIWSHLARDKVCTLLSSQNFRVRVQHTRINGGATMRRFTLALAAAVALGVTAASAADLGQRPVYKAQPAPVAIYNWSGF